MKQTRYPKRYATIAAVWEDGRFVAITDDGGTVLTSIRHRLGRGSSRSLVPGVRIKLFRRPQDWAWHFRKVGS